MNTNIVLQLGDPVWTQRALHLACALARNIHGRVILLDLRMVGHPGQLGWPEAGTCRTPDQTATFQTCADTCEDYGVDCVLQPMQYVSELSALQQAIKMLDASAVITQEPASAFRWLNQWRTWRLKHILNNKTCRVYLVGAKVSIIDWTPAAPRTATSRLTADLQSDSRHPAH